MEHAELNKCMLFCNGEYVSLQETIYTDVGENNGIFSLHNHFKEQRSILLEKLVHVVFLNQPSENLTNVLSNKIYRNVRQWFYKGNLTVRLGIHIFFW